MGPEVNAYFRTCNSCTLFSSVVRTSAFFIESMYYVCLVPAWFMHLRSHWSRFQDSLQINPTPPPPSPKLGLRIFHFCNRMDQCHSLNGKRDNTTLLYLKLKV